MLDNTTLPSEIEGEYNDGFENLTKMLYAQFGEDIKFIEAVDVTINDYNISNEDVTDENGDTVYNTTSSSSDSEEFTTGYGDSSEIDGEETSATKSVNRLPMKTVTLFTVMTGSLFTLPNRAKPQKKECLSPMKTVTLFTVTTVCLFTAQKKAQQVSLPHRATIHLKSRLKRK